MLMKSSVSFRLTKILCNVTYFIGQMKDMLVYVILLISAIVSSLQ